MKQLILFFCISRFLFSYTDPEIEALLLSLSDPFNPTLEDYRLIEHYFQHGERPYLEMMRKNTHLPAGDLDFRIHQLRNFKLVGPNGEMPILKLYASRVTENTKDRCIIIHVSYNQYYPESALRLFEELKECGYSGYIILRIGGIPDISHGGARLCTIPYTRRIDLFKEALSKGFTKILYLDATLHPLSDLTAIFDVIDDYGLFSCTNGAWGWGAFINYFTHLKIPFPEYEIPWIYGHTIGLNFTNEKVVQLFQKWDQEMHRLEDFCSLGDDVLFTCLIWDLGFRPFFLFSEIIGLYDFQPPIQSYPPLLLYQDTHRYSIRSGWGSVYD